MTNPAPTLLLIRHAKSDWQFTELDDVRRPLSRRGLRDCLHFAPLLATRLPRPSRLLVSPAARAVQTAQALADAFELDSRALTIRPALYPGEPDALLGELAGVAATTQVTAVVGHNPGLNDLYTWLTGEALDNLPTFGVAWLRVQRDSWTLRAGECECQALLTPRSIRDG